MNIESKEDTKRTDFSTSFAKLIPLEMTNPEFQTTIQPTHQPTTLRFLKRMTRISRD